MTTKTPIRAGGVVLLRETRKGPQTLLIHRPHHQDWSLPKGKVHSGETTLDAAVRECQEETGVRPILGPSLGRQRYQVMGRPKTVDYWAARVGQDHDFEPNDEVDQIRWVYQNEARSLLTYERDVEVMDAAFVLPETIALIVVRHARALKRAAFSGKDERRPLANRGLGQSDQLVSLLRAYGVSRLFSSPATRCLETVRPYSTTSGAKIKRVAALGEASFAADPKPTTKRVRVLIRKSKSPIAICSHRPVLPNVLATLAELPGFDSALTKDPLRPCCLIVAHCTKGKDKRVVDTELHEFR